MQAKKSKKANLEIRKTVFFQIGMAVTLLLVILAFEWEVPRNNDIDILTSNWNPDEIDEIIATKQEKEKIELPKPKVVNLIQIVEDEIIIDETIDISSEVDENTFNEPDLIWEEEYFDEPDEIIPFSSCEEYPEFPGGEASMMKFLSENLVYPQEASSTGIEGTVYVSFTIFSTGKITDVKVIRGVISSLDEEAKRVIKKMPKWKPGMQRNKAVSVAYVIPIKFKLN